MAVTYTFENVVINGVDTTRPYNEADAGSGNVGFVGTVIGAINNGKEVPIVFTDSTLPLRGVKRIICNGTDRLHKNVNTDLPYSNPGALTHFKIDFTDDYVRNVLLVVGQKTLGFSAKYYWRDVDTAKGFDITFDIPASVFVEIEEDDTIAGDWVYYDIIDWKNVTTLSVMVDEATNSITFTSNQGTMTYGNLSESGYELGVFRFDLTVKGRAY